MWDKKENLRVAVYMRVATSEQTEDARFAMFRQEALLEKLATDCGNSVTGRFCDYANGIRFDRPGLCAALEALKSGQADALLVKDFTRLGRDAYLTGELVRRLRADGKPVFFADDLMQSYVLKSGS